MTKTLTQAFERASGLPEETQEYIGQAVLNRIHVLERLRAQIAIGMRELDAGKRIKINPDAFIKEMRKKYAKGK